MWHSLYCSIHLPKGAALGVESRLPMHWPGRFAVYDVLRMLNKASLVIWGGSSGNLEKLQNNVNWEFVHSRVDQMVKRCLEVPSRITVVREEHFVSPKARPSFSLSSPEFRTDSLRRPCTPGLMRPLSLLCGLRVCCWSHSMSRRNCHTAVQQNQHNLSALSAANFWVYAQQASFVA